IIQYPQTSTFFPYTTLFRSAYKNRIKEMRDYFEIPITFKIGVETFDYDFRNGYLNKNAKFKTVEELKEYFDSPCIMVGESKYSLDRKSTRLNSSHVSISYAV